MRCFLFLLSALLLIGCELTEKVKAAPPVVVTGDEVEVKGIRNGQLLPESRNGEVRQFPEVGRVRPGNMTWLCSGTLVGPRHVLTAAHCVGDGSQPMYFGGPAKNLNGAQRARRVYVHPEEAGIGSPDLALLVLENAMPQAPVALIDSELVPTNQVDAVGFGYNVQTNDALAGYVTLNRPSLASFQIARLDPTIVPTLNGAYVINTTPRGLIRTLPNAKNQMICPGDSGGPLLANTSQGRRIAGVASFIQTKGKGPIAICLNATAGAHVSVARFLPWLRASIRLSEIPTAGRWVTRLYNDVLDREPSPSEVAFWTGQLDAGSTPSEIAKGFTRSEEAARNLVKSYYQIYLRREGEPSGVDHWTRELTLYAKSEQQVQAAFLASEEFYNRMNRSKYSYIASLYIYLLGRQASTSELQGWVDELNKDGNRDRIARGFLVSEEYRMLLAKDFYRRYLRRTAEIPGQPFSPGFWANILSTAAAQDVRAGFLGSNEYRLEVY